MQRHLAASFSPLVCLAAVLELDTALGLLEAVGVLGAVGVDLAVLVHLQTPLLVCFYQVRNRDLHGGLGPSFRRVLFGTSWNRMVTGRPKVVYLFVFFWYRLSLNSPIALGI